MSQEEKDAIEQRLWEAMTQLEAMVAQAEADNQTITGLQEASKSQASETDSLRRSLAGLEAEYASLVAKQAVLQGASDAVLAERDAALKASWFCACGLFRCPIIVREHAS